MKYFLIAGEASGDLHASNLMSQIKNVDKNADFMFFGGDLMQAQGGKMLRHYREMAYMGVIEVLANIGKIKKNFEICHKNLLEYKPDAVILVDYPGFNLKVAKFAKEHGFKTFYYISPKIWAWKKKRAFTIKKYVDKMFAIFPFEVDFYKQFDYKVDYVGNPLVDAMRNREKDFVDENEFRKKYNLNDLPIIALVPGSRRSEIEKLLPEMIGILPHFRQYQFIITGAPGIEHDFYNKYTQNQNVTVIFDDTYNVIRNSVAAVVTSGTATLETAFLKTPQVVVYKMNYISYLAAKTFVKIKYFSLVNIILERLAVKELLQAHLTDDIVNELQKILLDQTYRQRMLKSYDEIQTILGNESASLRTAEVIYNDIKTI
ncbi:MAG: lipid-A-disaccharide synthase [Bacteroidales bacterium]|nr:lipid-A-disaccharide synthase [Bacteroidales bacterium]